MKVSRSGPRKRTGNRAPHPKPPKRSERLAFRRSRAKAFHAPLQRPNGGCGYGSENNVSGLSAESMSIDDGEDYSLVGEPITLGGGGLVRLAYCGDEQTDDLRTRYAGRARRHSDLEHWWRGLPDTCLRTTSMSAAT